MPVVYGQLIDVINNVHYNWKRRGAGGNPISANFINNYAASGPATTKREAWSPQPHSSYQAMISQSVFEAGTVISGSGMKIRGSPDSVYRSIAWPLSVSGYVSALQAYDTVLDGAGAQPRDAIDGRVIDDVRNRTGTYPNGTGLVW
jgi:hypothetical protein